VCFTSVFLRPHADSLPLPGSALPLSSSDLMLFLCLSLGLPCLVLSLNSCCLSLGLLYLCVPLIS
ncbi:hypothetical protein NDU88_007447, partial [Pleurodeles waltl]